MLVLVKRGAKIAIHPTEKGIQTTTTLEVKEGHKVRRLEGKVRRAEGKKDRRTGQKDRTEGQKDRR